MAKIPVGYYKGLDLSSMVRNWTQDEDGGQRRMGNRADACRLLADAINNALAWHVRPIFSMQWPIDQAENANELYYPLCMWKYLDIAQNEREYRYNFIGVPVIGEINPSNCWAEQVNVANHYDTTAKTPLYGGNVAAVNKYYDTFSTYFYSTRNDALNAIVVDGITSSGGFTILAVNNYATWLSSLDTTKHVYCNPELAKKGKWVLADAIKDLRDKFHEVRQHNLGIALMWTGQGTHSPADPGDSTCLVVDSAVSGTDYVNLFDHTITARAGNSPGCFIDVEHAGVGPEWTTEGKKVYVQCAVYGYGTNAGGYVKFEGPSGNCEIGPITATGWYGGDGSFITLDSSVGADDFTTAANKIDVMGKVDSGAAMYIYSMCAWIVYYDS